MELKYLDIFCKVAELRSFTKAAEALYLTQPTVSIHMKTLEDEILGTRLFDRAGRTVVPTPAGAVLYNYAREIVRLKDEAKQALDQFAGKMTGRLRIGASTIPGEYILPALISRFKGFYPEVVPVLKIADTMDITKQLLNADVEIGVVGAFVKDKAIASREFLEDELVLVGSVDFKKTRLDASELKDVPLVLRERGSGSRAALETFLKKRGVDINSLNIVSEMGSTQAMRQAVRTGLGLSYLSRLAVKEDLDNGHIKEVKVKDFSVKRRFYIITRRNRQGSPVAGTFINFLLEKH
ncbi:MAG: LysR family transcriptional regulator [Deltaproteobacteria bacterium]|nr:LysR family transcriptional regulator [Deltaproteobacteria bacterium]